jgi:hypothetical protein
LVLWGDGQMMDDDEGYPPEGGCLGIGSFHTISERAVRKSKREPIGFIHFPDPPVLKARRSVKTKPKLKARRKK